jgi:hypothetical protein
MMVDALLRIRLVRLGVLVDTGMPGYAWAIRDVARRLFELPPAAILLSTAAPFAARSCVRRSAILPTPAVAECRRKRAEIPHAAVTDAGGVVHAPPRVGVYGRQATIGVAAGAATAGFAWMTIG